MHPKITSRVLLAFALAAGLSFTPLADAKAQHSGHDGHEGHGAKKPAKKAPAKEAFSARRARRCRLRCRRRVSGCAP